MRVLGFSKKLFGTEREDTKTITSTRDKKHHRMKRDRSKIGRACRLGGVENLFRVGERKIAGGKQETRQVKKKGTRKKTQTTWSGKL